MSNEYTWAGTGLKYAVSMTCEGFDMDEDDWTITVARGNKTIVFDANSAIRDNEGQWYICFDSAFFGPGRMTITFDASVPDEDFDEGIRHEIQRYDLINIKSL